MLRRSWKQSLAGAVLFAALAPVSESPHAQGPGPGGPGVPGGAPGRAGGEKPDEAASLQEQARFFNEETQRARDRLTELKRVFKSNDKQVVDLEARLAKLEQEKAKVEADIKRMQSRSIRVFRLKHAKPEEVRQVLESLLGGASGTFGAGPMMGPGGPGMPGMMGGKGGRGPMGPGMGGPPGMMAGPGGAGGNEDTLWRVTVDERTRSLIVRGSRHDLQLAADLVAVLDQAGGKAVPKVSNLHAFKLKFAHAPRLAQILDDLGVKARVVPLQKANILIVTGPAEAVTEVSELVKELDVEAKEAD
jgi:type II secretory pathway component GspD/PulD (secretin)